MKKREHGFLLITTLLVMVLLMILGMTLLTATSQDYQFAQKELKNLQAYYLAKGGLEYYDNVTFPSSQVTVLSRGKRYDFQIRAEGDQIFCTGRVRSNDGKVLSAETLVGKEKGL